jgi:uncharacterized membrane protein YfcA
MTLVALTLSALIGLSLGLLGAGGSILTVPVLVYVLDLGAKSAIATSLLVVGVTSAVGALVHRRLGHVRLRTALTFAPVAMAGAYLGARLAERLTGGTQLLVLGVAMVAAAVSLASSAPRPDGAASRPDRAPPRPVPGLALTATIAFPVGVLTGIAGVGGGFLIVPALVLLAGLPMKDAVGTSLVVIALNSAAAFAGYAGRVEVPWALLAAFTLVAIAGITGGAALVRFVPQAALKRAFAAFLLVMGLFVVYQNHTVAFADVGSPPAAAHAGRR